MFCDRPINEKENPQKVLLERRPDIQHLPLTCENTNTPLPYIDVVNETLEYYVTNSLTLDNYAGHSTDGDVTAGRTAGEPAVCQPMRPMTRSRRDLSATFTLPSAARKPAPLFRSI